MALIFVLVGLVVRFGDVIREATRDEVAELKAQNDELKRELANLYLETKSLKKSLNGYK